MRTLYEAASAIEAHMLRDLLRQVGLTAQIQGEHLQGALGELPAAGLVRLVVDEPDYAAARALIDHWESAQPADASAPLHPTAPAGWTRFVIGLLIGVGVTWAFLRAPVTTDGIDHDRDGVADRRSHHVEGVPTTNEIIDPTTGLPLRVEHYRLGVLVEAEVDTDRDGVLDTRLFYTPLGEISSRARIAN